MALIFDGQLLDREIKKKGWKNSDFVRALVKIAPESVRPNEPQLSLTIRNETVPSVNYVSLYAELLGLKIEDLLVPEKKFSEVTKGAKA